MVIIQDAAEEAGIPVRRQYICYSDLNYDHGLQTMRTLLHLDVPPTAVFAVGDMLAIGAPQAIPRRRGPMLPKTNCCHRTLHV